MFDSSQTLRFGEYNRRASLLIYSSEAFCQLRCRSLRGTAILCVAEYFSIWDAIQSCVLKALHLDLAFSSTFTTLPVYCTSRSLPCIPRYSTHPQFTPLTRRCSSSSLSVRPCCSSWQQPTSPPLARPMLTVPQARSVNHSGA